MLANGGTLTAGATTTNLLNGSTPQTTADLAAIIGGGASPNGLCENVVSGQLSMSDAVALLGLSQFLAAQQQQNFVQQYHAAQRQTVQHHNIVQDKKRSYPCTFQFCVLCQKNVHSSKLPCHIRQCHVAKPMFRCPVCDFTSTYSKNNVKSHMVSLHGLSGDPISYMEQYASQVEEYMKKCFPNVRGRGRPMHGGGRQSPASPVSSISAENGNSRRASLTMASTNGINSRQYTHSQKRMTVKQASQLSINEQISIFDKSSSPDLKENGISATVDVKSGMTIKLEPKESCSGEQNSGILLPKSEMNDLSSSLVITDRQDCYVNSNEICGTSMENSKEPQILFDSITSRYLLHNLDWQALSDEQVVNTVFSKFNTQSALEKLDLTPFESLLEETTLLNAEHVQKITEVRRQINLQTFEIMFAVHRLDLAVLSVEKVDLVKSIAPSAIDAHRFKTYEMSNSINGIGENEQFILQLSKIDRLDDKLEAMIHMGRFAQHVNDLLQQIEDLSAAADLLFTSNEFHEMLQLLLTCGNIICGDFNAQVVKGFRTSSLIQMCSFKFPSSDTTLLNVIAKEISNHFPELKRFREMLQVLDKAAKVNISTLAAAIRQLELKNSLTASEIRKIGATSTLSDFLENAGTSIIELKNVLNSVTEKLIVLLKFFGESVNTSEYGIFHPETFFSTICSFYRSLQKALVDLHL